MVTLDRLVNVLGSYGVRLRFCPIPRSTELRSVVMHELTEDRTVVGDVSLSIGARSVKEAVRGRRRPGAVVVLIRGGDDDDAAFSGAAEGVAVMVVDPAMSWSELAAVIYGLVLEGRETESGRGPTDLFALADSLAEATGGAVIITKPIPRLSRSWLSVLRISSLDLIRTSSPGFKSNFVTGVGPVTRPLTNPQARPSLMRSRGGSNRLLACWKRLNSPKRTVRSVANTPAFPERTSVTNCPVERRGKQVGAARSSSVAWQRKRSSPSGSGSRRVLIWSRSGVAPVWGSPSPPPGLTFLSQASFQ